jgi:hypothetical protein
MYDISERFKILCLETAEEYLAKNQIQQAMWACTSHHRHMKMKDKGVCEGCGGTEYLRWDENEVYICYDCYYYSMQLTGDHYSYHGRSAEDVPGFMYDDEWLERWEEENPHMIYDEEEDEYYDKTRPRRKKTKEEVAHKKAKVKRVSNEVSDYYEELSGRFD